MPGFVEGNDQLVKTQLDFNIPFGQSSFVKCFNQMIQLKLERDAYGKFINYKAEV